MIVLPFLAGAKFDERYLYMPSCISILIIGSSKKSLRDKTGELAKLHTVYIKLMVTLRDDLDKKPVWKGGSSSNMKKIDKKVLGRCVYVSPSRKQYVKNKNEWVQLAEFRKMKAKKHIK